MLKLISFSGLALLAFFPIFLVQATSFNNLLFSAQLSQTFAVLSLFFSTFYMAQRQYVNIYGPVSGNIISDIYFRCINILLASLICAFFLLQMSMPLTVIVFGIFIKVSEGVLDYYYGYSNYKKGFRLGSLTFFFASSVRFFFLVLVLAFSFFLFSDNITVISLSVSLASFLFMAVFLFFFLKNALLSNCWRKRVNYIWCLKKLLPFSLSASLCAALVVLPRWLVRAGTEEENVFLIAFSLVPIFGLFFNTLFTSQIDLSKKRIKHVYCKMFVVICGINLLAFVIKPLGLVFLNFIYGENIDRVDIFYESLLLGLLFFSSILFANFFKLNFPVFEGVTYFFGCITMVSVHYMTDNIYYSVIMSSLIIFMISLFSLKADDEKNVVLEDIK